MTSPPSNRALRGKFRLFCYLFVLAWLIVPADANVRRGAHGNHHRKRAPSRPRHPVHHPPHHATHTHTAAPTRSAAPSHTHTPARTTSPTSEEPSKSSTSSGTSSATSSATSVSSATSSTTSTSSKTATASAPAVTSTPTPGVANRIVTVASGYQNDANIALATSATGVSVLAVGDYQSSINAGNLYVHSLDGGLWSGSTLIDTGAASNINLGNHIAVSPDATVIAAAIQGTCTLHFLTATGSSWSSPASATVSCSNYPLALALSSAGAVVAVGDGIINKVHVLSGSGGSWGSAIELSVPPAAGSFGISVALSFDGTVLVVGSYNDNSAAGSVYVYTGASASTLATSTPLKITRATVTAGDYLGLHVACNRDCTFIAATASGANGGAGYVDILTTADGWTTYSHVASIAGSSSSQYLGHRGLFFASDASWLATANDDSSLSKATHTGGVWSSTAAALPAAASGAVHIGGLGTSSSGWVVWLDSSGNVKAEYLAPA